MPVICSLFFVAAWILSVTLGPQTLPWTWGPAITALGLAVLAALPVIWKRGKIPADFGAIALGLLAAAWFAGRAWISPVAQLGQSDLLLIGAAVGTFISIRAISGNARAERILIWGVALLLLANVLVIAKQLADPGFAPVFKAHLGLWPSGFLSHYNEAANYLIASSMLVGAAAIFGRHAMPTRILWFLIALAGLAAVWFTRSRGGIFGAAVACGVFASLSLVIGKRHNARWFAPALVAIPLIGLAIGTFLFMGWQDAQTTRQSGLGLDSLLDNTCRLYFLGLAFSCIELHPVAGGGSRSFSWECYRFWEQKAQGAGATRPEMVHNEFVQSATDYGLVGAGLLVGLLATLALVAILRVLFEDVPSSRDSRDSWRLGALAALAGMLVQSCFSFVFHLLPGILLLGVCLGQMSWPAIRPSTSKTLATRILLTITAIACAILLLPAGWKGSQVLLSLWPTHFSQQANHSPEARIDALSTAIQLWPQSTFYQQRAALYQTIAGSKTNPGFREPAELAVDDYQQASRLHPFDPALEVNRANLLSQLLRDSEAEAGYAKAIELQGGMESGFRSHFSFATHALRKSFRIYRQETPAPALDALELAAQQIETSVLEMHGVAPDMWEPRVTIHESLGSAREAAGNRPGALEAYHFATTIGGTRAHYRAAALIGKIAVEAWANRHASEALTGFTEARKRLDQAGNSLPSGVTPGQRAEYLAYLDRMIAFLIGAKIQPR
jgi:tetratricopeptide (TPR) repeat protein